MLQLIYELRKNCCGTGRDGTGGWVEKSKVLQEVLADLKRQNLAVEHCETIPTFEFQMLKAKQKTKGHFDFVAVATFSCVFFLSIFVLILLQQLKL